MLARWFYMDTNHQFKNLPESDMKKATGQGKDDKISSIACADSTAFFVFKGRAYIFLVKQSIIKRMNL